MSSQEIKKYGQTNEVLAAAKSVKKSLEEGTDPEKRILEVIANYCARQNAARLVLGDNPVLGITDRDKR